MSQGVLGNFTQFDRRIMEIKIANAIIRFFILLHYILAQGDMHVKHFLSPLDPFHREREIQKT
jgi:hypothetical protein